MVYRVPDKFMHLLLRQAKIMYVYDCIMYIDVHNTQYNTMPFKINHPVYNIGMQWTNFWPLAVHVQQDIFGKTLIGACSPNLYPSVWNISRNVPSESL